MLTPGSHPDLHRGEITSSSAPMPSPPSLAAVFTNLNPSLCSFVHFVHLLGTCSVLHVALIVSVDKLMPLKKWQVYGNTRTETQLCWHTMCK